MIKHLNINSDLMQTLTVDVLMAVAAAVALLRCTEDVTLFQKIPILCHKATALCATQHLSRFPAERSNWAFAQGRKVNGALSPLFFWGVFE